MTTPWYEAIVDSGADVCVFDASIAKRLGIKLEESGADEMAVLGRRGPGYPQELKIIVGSHSFQTTVLFFEDLPLAGLLGRKGFFDNFTITFDHSTEPPSLLYERIVRT
jgi:hypothetical protein